MSGRRLWRRAYKHFRIVRRSRREQHQTVRNLRQGVWPGGERREDQASARVSLKGTRVSKRWRGHRTDERKGPRADSAPTARRTTPDERVHVRPARRNGREDSPASTGLARRAKGQDGDDRNPERGKAHGGTDPVGTRKRCRRGTDRTRGRSPGAAAGDARTNRPCIARVGGRPSDDPTGHRTHQRVGIASPGKRQVGPSGGNAATPARGSNAAKGGTPGAPPVQHDAGCAGQVVRRLARVAEHRP